MLPVLRLLLRDKSNYHTLQNNIALSIETSRVQCRVFLGKQFCISVASGRQSNVLTLLKVSIQFAKYKKEKFISSVNYTSSLSVTVTPPCIFCKRKVAIKSSLIFQFSTVLMVLIRGL